MSHSKPLSNRQTTLLFVLVVVVLGVSMRSAYLLFILNDTGRPTLTEATSFIAQNFINFGATSGGVPLAEVPLVIFAVGIGFVITFVIVLVGLMLYTFIRGIVQPDSRTQSYYSQWC